MRIASFGTDAHRDALVKDRDRDVLEYVCRYGNDNHRDIILKTIRDELSEFCADWETFTDWYPVLVNIAVFGNLEQRSQIGIMIFQSEPLSFTEAMRYTK